VVRDSAEDRAKLAALALRRWRGFGRRSKVTHPTDEDRIEDLAKGLRDACEATPGLAGPLIEDYRYLAGVIAAVMTEPL